MTASAFELLGAPSYRVKDLVTAGEARGDISQLERSLKHEEDLQLHREGGPAFQPPS